MLAKIILTAWILLTTPFVLAYVVAVTVLFNIYVRIVHINKLWTM